MLYLHFTLQLMFEILMLSELINYWDMVYQQRKHVQNHQYIY